MLKRYKNRLARTVQTNSEDVYQLYMNAFTKTYDPHTQYFSPRTSENFNINMSLSLEGIGAVLALEDEYTKVVSLVPAGPADKAGQLKPNDKIVAVAQGLEGEMVDVITAPRSTGSILKPFLYALSLDEDLSHLPALAGDVTDRRLLDMAGLDRDIRHCIGVNSCASSTIT